MPSELSTWVCGTWSLYLAGARFVHRSTGSVMCESASISFRPAKGPVSRGLNDIFLPSHSCAGLSHRAPVLRRLRLCHRDKSKSTLAFTPSTCPLYADVYVY